MKQRHDRQRWGEGRGEHNYKRRKSEYVYRINPYQPREIDRRLNRHRARWERYTTCVSAEGATKMLLKLEADKDEDE